MNKKEAITPIVTVRTVLFLLQLFDVMAISLSSLDYYE